MKDIVKQDFHSGLLAVLKEALVSRFTPSRTAKIREVLDNLHFKTDESPSEFFRKLFSMAEDLIAYDIILQRFHERLPSLISTSIAPMVVKIRGLYQQTNVRPIEEERLMF